MLAMPGLRTGKLALDTFELFRQLLTEQRPVVRGRNTILMRDDFMAWIYLGDCRPPSQQLLCEFGASPAIAHGPCDMGQEGQEMLTL